MTKRIVHEREPVNIDDVSQPDLWVYRQMDRRSLLLMLDASLHELQSLRPWWKPWQLLRVRRVLREARAILNEVLTHHYR